MTRRLRARSRKSCCGTGTSRTRTPSWWLRSTRNSKLSRSPSWRLPPLLLFAGAVACSPKPSIGIEAILDSTGLGHALLERSGASFEVVVDESKNLLEKMKSGELDLVVADDDLGIDALLRSGDAGAADPLLHGEIVLVGPDKDPLALHAERNFKNSLRLIIEGDAAFFQCVPCGTRARGSVVGPAPRSAAQPHVVRRRRQERSGRHQGDAERTRLRVPLATHGHPDDESTGVELQTAVVRRSARGRHVSRDRATE